MPDWPHAPPHKLFEPGTYMVTGATLYKKHFFDTPGKLGLLQDCLLQTLQEFGWRIQAWSVMVNHYHIIAHCEDDPDTLRKALSKTHSVSAREVNKLDGVSGRKIWYQFWEKQITYQKSYFPRLRYVHENAVHHGLVKRAEDYEWCSAGWLKEKADAAYRRTIESFKTDRLKIYDDF